MCGEGRSSSHFLPLCISERAIFGKMRVRFSPCHFLAVFLSIFLGKYKNTARLCGVFAVHLFSQHVLLNIELPDPSYLWTSKARLSQEGDGPSFFIHIAFLNILLFPKAVYGTCPLLCCWDRARKRMLISQWSPMIPAAGGTVWDGSLILPSTRDLRFQNFPKIWDWRSNS